MFIVKMIILNIINIYVKNFKLYIFFLDSTKPNMTVGLELFFQNAFIFTASLIYKFGRVEDQW